MTSSTLDYQVEIFTNRLKKRFKHLGKWARRNGITCFRVYDRDIPEIPLIVDLYENHLHIAEFARGREMAESITDEFRSRMTEAARRALGVQPERVFYKQRRRTAGSDQYERISESGRFVEVGEGGLRFLVNFTDYLDTGLFLDHRITRSMMRDLVSELAAVGPVRVLNLFSYTASFSVYAADGGAFHTVSVDMSRTYSQWAQDNLALNGMDNERNITVTDDVTRFIEHPDLRQYSLAVLDPPTFSNSKKMDGVLDVQRDHVDLLQATGRFLTSGGFLLFSTNKRSFKLDEAGLSGFRISDITSQTIPQDFRDQRIHHCWLLEKRR